MGAPGENDRSLILGQETEMDRLPRPTPQTPLEELLGRFLRAGEEYISWHNLHILEADRLRTIRLEHERRMRERAARRPVGAARGRAAELFRYPEDFRSMLEAANFSRSAGGEIKRVGPLLADALEARDINATVVLHQVHCADGGGGASKFAKSWAKAKVFLQRVQLRIRPKRGRGRAGAAGRRGKGRGPAVNSGCRRLLRLIRKKGEMLQLAAAHELKLKPNTASTYAHRLEAAHPKHFAREEDEQGRRLLTWVCLSTDPDSCPECQRARL